MVQDAETKLSMLKRQRDLLLERAKRMPVAQQNEAYRKVVLIEDEMARYRTTNRWRIPS